MDEHERKNRKLRALWEGVAQRTGTSAPAACPDPEILSAYFTHMLGKNEAAQWEPHFSACSSCQEALGALVKTAGPDEAAFTSGPVHADEPGGAELADAAAQLSRFGQGVPTFEAEMLAPAAASPAPAPTPMRPVAPRPPQTEIPRRERALWRWLVPAVAAATVFAVLVTVRLERRTTQRGLESAENKPLIQPTETPSANENSPAAGSSVTPAIENQKKGAAPTASLDGKLPPSSDTTSELTKKVAPSVSTAPAGRGDGVSAPKRASSDSNAAAAPAPVAQQPQPRADDKIEDANGRSDAAKLEERGPAKRASAEADALSRAAGQGLDDKSQQTKPALEGRLQSEAGPLNAYRAREPAGIVGGIAAQTAETKLVRDARSGRFFAPGRRVIWSVGPGGTVSRSQDGGSTWTKQDTGVTAELFFASAPSDTVCWVVGRAGTILLTTDGYHWSKLSSPEPLDWIGVRAVDALHAVIWDISRTHRFSTSDGGQTWQSAAQ